MYGKRKTIISIIAVLLAAALVFSLLAGVLSVYAVSDRDRLKELKAQLAEVTEERNSIKAELNEMDSQLQQMFSEKIALEQEINLTYEQIELTEQIITSLDESIEETTEKLHAAEDDEARQYELFKNRVRAMYENDSMTLLDLVFSASSFTEYMSRLEAASSIVSYDKNLMYRLAEIREYIEELKRDLEEDRQDNEQHKADLEAYKVDLTRQTAALDQLILDLQQQMEEKETELEENAEEQAAYQKAIDELAEKIRKEEEEAARAAAAAAAAAAARANAAAASTYSGGQMSWPLPGYYTITSDYAMRNHPITGKYSQHTGIDIAAPKNTKITCASAGTVVSVGYNTAYGNRVIVDHGGGVQTLYAHMSSFAVKEGDSVSAGTVLGYVGSTGYATGNHLHFSVLVNGSYVDPKKYVKG